MKALAIFVVALGMMFLLEGCLADAPTVPVTAVNSGQVGACQSAAKLHNGLLATDIGLGAAATGLGAAAAALSPSSDKTAFAISAAVVAGLGIATTGWEALAASSFSDNKCSTVLGPLPTAEVVPPATDSVQAAQAVVDAIR